MAAAGALSCHLYAVASPLCWSCSLKPALPLRKAYHSLALPFPKYMQFNAMGRSRRSLVSPSALFGGGKKGGEENKFITKEQEPDQYWQTAAEKEGKGPMSTVLPYIAIFGFATPFIILGLGFLNGWIKIPVR